MEYLDQYGIKLEYILIGYAIALILIFILLIIIFSKNRSLRKRYTKFMTGTSGDNIEKIILARFEDIEYIKKNIGSIDSQIEKIINTLEFTYQKCAIIKYDAFKEMGGKLSFALALLNETNDGFVINSMHSSREGCYTYIKEIIKGESFVVLAEEEKQALEEAINSNKYMH